MKETKLEKQLKYFRDYLEIKPQNDSNQYWIFEKIENENLFITNTQPKLINGKYGQCYLFEFDNGNLFAPCGWVCFCRDEYNNVLIKQTNTKWHELAKGNDDFCYAKDVAFQIKIAKNGSRGKNNDWKKLENVYNEKFDWKLEKLS